MNRNMTIAQCLTNRRSLEILEAVKLRPNSTLTEIARRISAYPGATHYHLKRLTSVGLLESETIGRQKVLYRIAKRVTVAEYPFGTLTVETN